MNTDIKTKSQEDKGVEKYNRQVYKMLVLPKRPRKILYDAISSGIYEFAENHTGTTYDKLIKHFGSPKELVETYIETSNYKEMHRSQKTKMRILKALLCVGIVIASVFFAWVVFDLQSKFEFRDGLNIRTIQDDDYNLSSLPVVSSYEW